MASGLSLVLGAIKPRKILYIPLRVINGKVVERIGAAYYEARPRTFVLPHGRGERVYRDEGRGIRRI